MKEDDNYESSDVEDRRGQVGPRSYGGGGGSAGMLFFLLQRFGWPGLVVGLGIFALLRFMPSGTSSSSSSRQTAGHDHARAFVGQVLDDVQKMWAQELPHYRHAKVILYADTTATGCGVGETAVGPFYCPADEKVYLDVTFFQLMAKKLGAPGDFAQAYVIAHELGHHVQKLTGVTERVDSAPRSEQLGSHGMSVKLELQADCYAGVWAASAERRGLLDPGDIEQAITAAAAVGDDRLQREATGTVQPEKWTHGSSAERMRWFQRGRERGMTGCDTFSQ
jgi:predicted metalloprotease